jgi:hypothetical protein
MSRQLEDQMRFRPEKAQAGRPRAGLSHCDLEGMTGSSRASAGLRSIPCPRSPDGDP